MVIKGLKAQGTEKAPELNRLINTRDVAIFECIPQDQISTFLSVFGEHSDEIYIFHNILKKAKQNVELRDSLTETVIHEALNF